MGWTASTGMLTLPESQRWQVSRDRQMFTDILESSNQVWLFDVGFLEVTIISASVKQASSIDNSSGHVSK